MKVIRQSVGDPQIRVGRGRSGISGFETRLDARLMNASILKSDTRESTTITLRFDPRMLQRIKRIARSRYLNYQSMIKQWLSERGWRKRRDARL